MLDIHAHLRILSAKPGEVFDDHHVNLARINSRYHPLETRSFKIRATPAVITKTIKNLVAVCLSVAGEQYLLSLNAAAFSDLSIILAEAAVQCRRVFILLR